MAINKSLRYKINISPIWDNAWRIRFIQRLSNVQVSLKSLSTNTVSPASKQNNKLKWIYCKTQHEAKENKKKSTFTDFSSQRLFSCDDFFSFFFFSSIAVQEIFTRARASVWISELLIHFFLKWNKKTQANVRFMYKCLSESLTNLNIIYIWSIT